MYTNPHPMTLFPGQPYFQGSDSPTSNFSTVFEDDGRTGYFYAIQRGPDYVSNQQMSILDALNVYEAHQVTDKDKPSLVTIVWSKDGYKSLLLINDYSQAIFDFEAQRGYCRTNFPPPDLKWSKHPNHEWSDEALEMFRG
jgi:hypothetical protein